MNTGRLILSDLYYSRNMSEGWTGWYFIEFDLLITFRFENIQFLDPILYPNQEIDFFYSTLPKSLDFVQRVRQQLKIFNQ